MGKNRRLRCTNPWKIKKKNISFACLKNHTVWRSSIPIFLNDGRLEKNLHHLYNQSYTLYCNYTSVHHRNVICLWLYTLLEPSTNLCKHRYPRLGLSRIVHSLNYIIVYNIFHYSKGSYSIHQAHLCVVICLWLYTKYDVLFYISMCMY